MPNYSEKNPKPKATDYVQQNTMPLYVSNSFNRYQITSPKVQKYSDRIIPTSFIIFKHYLLKMYRIIY